MILTDVPGIMADFGTGDQHLLTDLSVSDLARLELPAGSMGPKAEAVRRFVAATGRRAAIGALDDLQAVVDGKAGTQVTLVHAARGGGPSALQE